MLYALVGYVVPVIHVLACLFLIVVVLLQTGKGADIGAVFGGGSQTLFGSGGAGNFLTKLTTGTAIAFMVTSLVLTWGASRAPRSTLIDQLEGPAASAPAQPGGDQIQQVQPGTAPLEIQPQAAQPAGEAPVAAAPAPAAPAPTEPTPAAPAPAAPAANP